MPLSKLKHPTTKRISPKSVYLDHAATTYVDPIVLKVMEPYFTISFGNPSSLYKLGREARSAMEKARDEVAKILGAEPEEITFTGSGTESDNLAIIGTAKAYEFSGKHIIISSIEHSAVIEAADKLRKEGFEVTTIGVLKNGVIKLDELKKALRPDTTIVSIMYANNEIGTIQPIREIADIIKEFRVKQNRSPLSGLPLFHSDACQAAGALPLNVNKLGVDLLTLNGGKIYGPKGVGCLYHRRSVRLDPYIVGGGQEKNIRSGTESVALIVGFAKALSLSAKNAMSENKRLKNLRDYFIKQLTSSIPKTTLNGHPAKRLPNNVNVSIFGIEGESMILALDSFGVYASTGSACAARSLLPSHVLLAIGLSPELAHGSLRFTLGRKTTKADIDRVMKILPDVVEELRKISPIRL
ncbi:MAG: cysteine desulfurase [Patescibacteria group bacterium]|nr:cysteine desulfurase [Patescibacteria group bacterium]